MEPFSFRFGELEAVLADLNYIPSAGRTAFQARLKNYHRLGFPKDIGAGRGKAVIYGVGQLVQMAVIVEMTQLGLTPERAIKVYEADEYPVLMAVSHAAGVLIGRDPDYTFHPEQGLYEENRNPTSMFLYFDPAALSPQTAHEEEDWASATFFYAGQADVRDNLTEWTTRRTRRLSLINVTALLWDLGRWIEDDQRDSFFKQIEEWAHWVLYRHDFELEQWLIGPVRRIMMEQAATPVHPFHPQPASGEWVSLPDLLKDGGFLDAAGEPVAVPEYGDASPATLFVLPEQEIGEFGAPKDDGPPDMIINLPGQRQLPVDTKTSPAVDTPSSAIRSRVEELAGQPFRTNIHEMAEKKGDKTPTGHLYTDRNPYTVLYLPGKQFFTDAFREDKRLWDWAFEKHVIIATPASLSAILREAQVAHIVAAAWEASRDEDRASTLTEQVISASARWGHAAAVAQGDLEREDGNG